MYIDNGRVTVLTVLPVHVGISRDLFVRGGQSIRLRSTGFMFFLLLTGQVSSGIKRKY